MYKLFDYQQKMVDEARISLARGHNGVLIVSPPGSGKSVVIAEIARLVTRNKNGHVLFFVHRQELVKQIKQSFEEQNVDLNKCTIMTVGKVKNRLKSLPAPTLIICDESQHAKAKTYMTIFNYYASVPRLGFSGSPWRMSGEGFDDIYSALVEGPSVQWLIDHHKLAPAKYYSVNLYDKNKLKKSSNGDYSQKSMDLAAENNLYGDILNTWKKIASDRQTIIYAHSTQHSQQIANIFQQDGINAKHCDFKTPKSERDRIVNDFRNGELQVLCNYGLFDEGYNVKECSCVVIARPTTSLVFDLQATMRCMRYLPNKEAIIIDHAANYLRFGFPQDDRDWSLTSRKRQVNSGDDEQIYVCDECLGVFRNWTSDDKCPYCGAAKPLRLIKQEQDKQKIIEAEIVEIQRSKKNERYAKNLLECMQIIKAKGKSKYPLPYALHVMKANGITVSKNDLNAVVKEYGYSWGYVYRIMKGSK
ncbi:DEAD/DEAH box helicase [Lactobacillus acetotolerans]|uniref:DEAD/DEAH box helicase n=1 Tax=Lactobacillus acetotolerans TaxID=1600 RepID=UPI002FD935C6